MVWGKPPTRRGRRGYCSNVHGSTVNGRLGQTLSDLFFFLFRVNGSFRRRENRWFHENSSITFDRNLDLPITFPPG